MVGESKGWHARGYLPHFDSPERVQHIVFRTAGSLPAQAGDMKPDAWNAALDRSQAGRRLADPAAAGIVEGAMLHFHAQRYRLLAWCVMPNHVHAVIEQVEGYPLGRVVSAWKGYAARRINVLQGRSGPFWASDYFDRYMRDATQLERAIAYVENNPVAAGLAARPEDWPFSSARLRRGDAREDARKTLRRMLA